METANFSGLAAHPSPFKLLYHVIWVIDLFNLPSRVLDRFGRFAVIVVNASSNPPIVFPALDKKFQSGELHSVGRSVVIAFDARLCLGHDLEIHNFLLPAIHEDDNAFFRPSTVTPRPIECNGAVWGHLISPMLAFLAAFLEKRGDELLLRDIQGRTGGEGHPKQEKDIGHFLEARSAGKD
jgi:hypothetical protein